LRAVDGLNLSVPKGTTLSLVGESGCGKSTVARLAVGLYRPSAGQVVFDGRDLAEARAASDQRRRMQMIFQDPYASLNPRWRVGDIIAEPIRAFGLLPDRAAQEARVAELLTQVGLSPLDGHKFPHEFSGGQRQRISIARALSSNPEFLVCDEPTSALDVSVQAQIINLLLDLQDRLGISMLFVAHDLSVVRHVSDRVAVMYVGRIVEVAPTDALYRAPMHPYTEALLAAVPAPDPARRGNRRVAQGEVADPANPPPGCAFHPRCPYATEQCRVERPALTPLSDGRWVSCHRAQELELAGVR
jgi:peptide/nickel transport system ATP-binding protein